MDYTYCHGSSRSAANGALVAAGQELLKTGCTGTCDGTHLHFQIKYAGVLRCPQNLLAALYDGRPVPLPTTLPTGGCTY